MRTKLIATITTLTVAAVLAVGSLITVEVEVSGPKQALAQPAKPAEDDPPDADPQPKATPASKAEPMPEATKPRPPAPKAAPSPEIRPEPPAPSTPEETADPKAECGPKSADAEGEESICEGDKVCNKDKCVADPCLSVTCSDSNTYGCQVAAALHFRGLTSEEAVRRYLLKSASSDAKMEAFNKGLMRTLRQTYASTYSYESAPADVKEMKMEDLCESLTAPMTKVDGLHLMYRIKRHDAALRDISKEDTEAEEAPKVEAPKAPKVMKAAPAPAAPSKLATPAVTPTPKGEERMVKLPTGLKK